MSVKSLSIDVTEPMAHWWKPLHLHYYDPGVSNFPTSSAQLGLFKKYANNDHESPSATGLFNTPYGHKLKWLFNSVTQLTMVHISLFSCSTQFIFVSEITADLKSLEPSSAPCRPELRLMRTFSSWSVKIVWRCLINQHCFHSALVFPVFNHFICPVPFH